jgi:hypothetical protein
VNTPTHLLINWTVAKSIPEANAPSSAVLLGAVAPDLPLYALSIGGIAWFRFVKGMPADEVQRHVFGNLFYNDPIWITLHNVLHSPLVLVVVLVFLYQRLEPGAFAQSWWTWFFASCLLHTLVDIPVHHDDGPLVFWPLNWTYRFSSPVSYWDTAHYGIQMMITEATLAVILAGRLIAQWLRSK